jgi:ATP-binding cassette subfamily B protein
MNKTKQGETPTGQFSKISMILHFLKGSIHFFVISILSAFLVTMTEMLIPQLIRFTVDSVIGTTEPDLPAILYGPLMSFGGAEYLRTHLHIIALTIVLLAGIAVICKYSFNVHNNKGAETLLQSMRNKLFAHIQKLPFEWHMKNQTGDIIQRCTSDVDRVKIFVADQLTSIIRIVILMSLSLFFMYSMNVYLALIATACIPVVMGYSAYFHSKIGSRFQECDESEGILSTIAQENLTGVRVVRAFGREKFERDRFEKENQRYADLWVKLCKFMAFFWGSGDAISGLQVMLVVVFGAVFCVKGSLSAGEFIAFLSYNSMLTWPVRQLGRVISEMSKANVSIDRIMYIMNSEEEKDKENAVTPDMHGDIQFSNVSFGYDAKIPVVQDVSFKIPAGTTFGILGGTGSGKSTLMLLLNRLYELDENCGQITIGGVDIKDMKASWIRQNVGMVLQEPFLFSRTIAENIGITKKDMPMEEIRRAAKIACVDEAITEFTNGYDTIVGERGVTLSGGQKQRTAIARMLTQQAPIMVFDDSLSAVDAETDMKIRQALRKNLGGSTVILISHRVTTLMQAECIMVLDKGRVAEMGSHDELMQKNGIYRHIYDMQMTMPEEVSVNE